MQRPECVNVVDRNTQRLRFFLVDINLNCGVSSRPFGRTLVNISGCSLLLQATGYAPESVFRDQGHLVNQLKVKAGCGTQFHDCGRLKAKTIASLICEKARVARM